MFRSIVRALLPATWYAWLREARRCYLDEYAGQSYSQEGEDLLLNRMFEGRQQGYYVDVGAFHPMKYSNTYLLYKRGWRGINIDAMPGSMKLFKKWRQRDINLEAAVSDHDATIPYYVFDAPALNGFSRDLLEKRTGSGRARLLFQKDLRTRTLASLLDEYLPSATHIEFLSIDVEGLDLNVLQSNDWARYAPAVVLVEMLQSSLDVIATSEITRFMHDRGYRVIAKTFNTVFFSNNPDFYGSFGAGASGL